MWDTAKQTISPLLTYYLAMCTFKTFNKISHLNSYILFESLHCSLQSSNRNMSFRYTI